MVAVTADDSRLKVFVSYSRDDSAFADELIDGLEFDSRFQVCVDHGASAGSTARSAGLGDLIAEADTVIFVLSPASAQSEICAWELAYAHELSKRIVPVQCQPLGRIRAPSELAGLKPARFDQARTFMDGLRALVSSLSNDVDWLREHTRLFALARDWQDAGESDNKLLTGTSIIAAKRWTFERPHDAPLPSDLHMEFISASETCHLAGKTAAAAPLTDNVASAAQAGMTTVRRGSMRLYSIAGALVFMLAAIAGWQVAEAGKQIASPPSLTLQPQAHSDAKAKLAALTQRIEVAMKTANSDLCSKARSATQTLGTTSDADLWDDSFDVFWNLMGGPLTAVEQLQKISSQDGHSDVADAMQTFAGKLGKSDEASYLARISGLPRPDLLEPARHVAFACR